MSQRAIVVFLSKDMVDDPAWYARWLKPGFVHCFVLVKSESNQWIKLEGVNGRLHVTQLALDEDAHGHYMRYVNRDATIVKIDVRSDMTLPRRRLPHLFVSGTCVGLIKSVLGIRSWAITPWQFYKYLTRKII